MPDLTETSSETLQVTCGVMNRHGAAPRPHHSIRFLHTTIKEESNNAAQNCPAFLPGGWKT
jgi:hypothetical protein